LHPLKIDLHIHTLFSSDSLNNFQDIIRYAKLRNLDGVAITDHNTVRGALEFIRTYKRKDLIIIPGIEVSTSCGHILGINVTEDVPKGLDPLETVELIHEAGGIAIAAHPYALHKESFVRNRSSLDVGLDGVEVVNSSVFPFYLSVALCKRFAAKHNLPETGGSDSHFPEAIGLAYTNIYAQSSLEEIVEAIRKGRVNAYGRPVPLTLRIKQLTKKLKVKSFRADKDLDLY